MTITDAIVVSVVAVAVFGFLAWVAWLDYTKNG